MRIINPVSLTGISKTARQEPEFGQADGTISVTTRAATDNVLQTVQKPKDTAKQEPFSSHKESLKRTAQLLNENPLVVERRLKFKIHDKTGQFFVQVTNADTGKVLSTIPPETVMDMHARLQGRNDTPPLMMDEKA